MAASCRTGSHTGPLVVLIVIAAGSALGLYLVHRYEPESLGITFHPPLFLFAILGVVFHMAAKYREVRDEGRFNLGRYWFDHLFRALQACLYVLIIDNWAGKETMGIDMAVVALLVGMYIRRVEVAFESLGDRFGEMIKSLIGASSQQVAAEKNTERIQELKGQLDALQQAVDALTGTGGHVPQEIPQMLQDAREQLRLECPDEAQRIIQDIGFKLKDSGLDINPSALSGAKQGGT